MDWQAATAGLGPRKPAEPEAGPRKPAEIGRPSGGASGSSGQRTGLGCARRPIGGRYIGRVTSDQRPPSVRPVDYKGEPLDAERGPGLGCFRFQVVLLLILVVLTPLTVAWGWPAEISIAFLILTLILLLFAGQTVIFLLRLVAADRREGVRHAPRASSTPTVGQLEDGAAHVDALGRPVEVRPATADDQPAGDPPADDPPANDLPSDRGMRE